MEILTGAYQEENNFSYFMTGSSSTSKSKALLAESQSYSLGYLHFKEMTLGLEKSSGW